MPRVADRVRLGADPHVAAAGHRDRGRGELHVREQHDVVDADVDLVARHLPDDARRAVAVGAMDGRADRGKECRIVRRNVLAVESVRILLGDERGREATFREPRMPHQRRLEHDVGRDAADHERVQRLRHPRDRLAAARRVHDELRDHRVVVHRDLAALVHAGVDAHAARHLLRRPVAHQASHRRQEPPQRILGVDAALDRPSVALDVGLRERQLLAGRDPDHPLDEVEPGDHLGDRMLDLQPRVHLEEVEAAVLADDELHGARRLVGDRARERHRLLAHRAARVVVEERRRRLLDHLLVAALDRALALPQVHEVAVRVAQHLDLDVARLLDVLLDEDAVVAEARLRLGAAGGEAFARLAVVVRDAQALAAAAGGRLDHHRIADVARDAHGLVGVLDDVGVAGDRRDLRLLRELLRRDLVAHRRDRRVLRADEHDARRLELARERLVLRQEPVARMHGLRAGRLARGDDLVHREVRLARRRRADADRLVGQLDVPGVAVRLGVHGDGRDAHAARGPDDAAGDLAAVGNQDLLEHGVTQSP